MSNPISRRDWLKTTGVAGAAAFVGGDVVPPLAHVAAHATPVNADTPALQPREPGAIVDLTSTSDIFTPPRGRGFQKFSFDFPEPSVAFGGYTFGFLVFTDENTYGLDRTKMSVNVFRDAITLHCAGFTWAGGQQTAPGALTASFRRKGTTIEWDCVVRMERPIKTVTSIIRGVPRGEVSLGGGAFRDPHDDELLAGYPFGGGDLNGPGGSMTTPLLMIKTPADVLFISSLDRNVRPKRFYLAPGATSYRVEAIHELGAWGYPKPSTFDGPAEPLLIPIPAWRLGRASTSDAAEAIHMQHIEEAFRLKSWESRVDMPAWMRTLALATTLHGMHYTGYIFNDFAKMLEILRWMSTQIPAGRVLAFIPAWDGRYYWDYPTYKVSERMGGESGFRRLIEGGQKLGFKMMPMYGANAANTKLPSWPKIADGVTRKIDGNVYNLDWVDWNNDRHGDGWLAYMNLGAEAWREHLTQRISDMIDRFGIDAYFLDIVGGHVNSTNGDMHEGTVRLVNELRVRYPRVACVGEMPYDALHGFIPMFQVGLGPRWSKYSRNFSHLSSPAPGRGSSGVHESGFGRFNTETLGLNSTSIPTLQVVDDTFTTHRDVMAAVIQRAKQRAGIV